MSNHTDLQKLIPWYVNGTLVEADQDRMTRHLKACPACCDEIEREITFARAICATPPGVEQISRTQARERLLANLPRSSSRRNGRRTAAALVVLAAIAATGFIAGSRVGEPAYQTLTAPAASDRPVLQLVFAPTAMEQEVRAALRAAGGTLLTAPSTDGVYRIALSPHQDGQALARRLRDWPGVRWAGVEQP